MFIPVLCFDCLGLNRPILGSLNNNRFFTKSSSETQGQIVGTRESLNGQKNMARRKVKNGAIWNPTKDFFESLIFSPFFTFLHATFFRPFRLSLVPTICPWVSEDVTKWIVLDKREWSFSLVLERGQPEAASSCQIPGHFNVGTGRKTRLMARFVLFCFFVIVVYLHNTCYGYKF